jgi:hypothetical protein
MIEKKFAFHTPSEAGKEKANQIREAFTVLHNVIQEVAPNSREKSVALTDLESAAMWAVKAVVINDPASVAQA